MKVRVNGRNEELADGVSLLDLLAERGIDRRYLVVEHNGEPLAPERFEAIVLRHGDRLELVRPVAGG